MANGRKSLSIGYNATVKADHSAAFSFNSIGCEIPSDSDNTIKFCADSISYNGVSLADVMDAANRRTLAAEDDASLHELEDFVVAKEMELAQFSERVGAILAHREAEIARNAAKIEALTSQ